MPDQPSPSASSAPAATPTPPVPQTSIAAELARVYDEKKAESDAKVTSGTPTPITAGQGNVTPEGPKRGEGGRFAPAEGKKPEAKADAKPEPKADARPDAKVEAKTDPKVEAKGEGKPEAKAAPIAPHPRWKPDVQEKFKGLAEKDPDLAKFVLDRQKESEGEFTKARQAAAQVHQQAEKFKAVEDVLATGRQARSLHGVDDPTYLRSLVAASDYLAKNPRAGIKMLAEQYGVSLKDLAEGKEEPQESPELRKLSERVAQQEKYIRDQNALAEQQRVQGAFGSIQQFAQAKDADGNLLHPHFGEVIDDVVTIVMRQKQAGQQPDLNAAYSKAIRLNDSVWTKLQAAQDEADRKTRDEEAAQRVRAAKVAGFSVSGSGGGGDQVAGSLRDELRRQVDKHIR